MGIFAYHIGKMDIPEEHREEWVRQMLELLRAGGMMTVETLQLYRKKIYLLSPPELDEEGRATGYYNYFEKECWEDWWLNAKRGDFKGGRFFTQEPPPLYPPKKRKDCVLDLPLRAFSKAKLHTLRKELLIDFCIYSIRLLDTVAALRFPLPCWSRQSRRFLESASLHPPPAALRRFPCSAWPLLPRSSKSNRWAFFRNEDHLIFLSARFPKAVQTYRARNPTAAAAERKEEHTKSKAEKHLRTGRTRCVWDLQEQLSH